MTLILLAAIIGSVQSNGEWHFTGKNVAAHKVTEQFPETSIGGVSQRAVDGRRDAYWGHNSCTQTAAVLNAPAYWSVDLNGKYTIKGFQIYNRDGLKERLDNFKIIGYPMGTTLYDDSTVQNKLSRQLIISIPVNSTFRFTNITIKIPAHEGYPDSGLSILTLCEVEVYAALYVCPVNTFGDQVRWNIRQGTGYLNVDRDFVSYQAIIDFTCSPNSALVGSANLTCLLNGGYSANVSTCMPYVCPFTKSDVNLEWNLNQATGNMNSDGLISSGTIINFGCKKKYNLVGVATVECLSNGMYSASLPWCNETRCTRPSDVIHGEYDQLLNESYPVGAIVTWNCSRGYKSNDIKSRQCTYTSSWSGDDPECTLSTCSYPNVLPNVVLTFDNDTTYTSGAVARETYVKVKCATGFETNVTRIACSLQEEWDALPTCLQITCEEIGEFVGGQYIYNSSGRITDQSSVRMYPYGTEATPVCKSLYRLTRGRQRVCGESRSWTSDGAVCEIQCDAPGDIINGQYAQPLHNEYLAGETVNWDCSDGYASLQNKTRQCQNSSKWSGSELACLQNSCSFPNGLYNVTLTFPNGSDFVSGNVAYNTYVTVHCDEGYTSNVKAITCTISTEWDYLPSCLQIYCDRIAEPATGVYMYLNENTNELCNAQTYSYGTVAVSLCDERATRYVGGERKCGENGRWSNQDNTCGKPDSSEQSALAPSAVGGITAGTFVVGMAAGIAVAWLISVWRRRKDTPADTTNSRDSAYCTPMEARPEDLNYEQLNEGARNDNTDTYDRLNVQSNF